MVFLSTQEEELAVVSLAASQLQTGFSASRGAGQPHPRVFGSSELADEASPMAGSTPNGGSSGSVSLTRNAEASSHSRSNSARRRRLAGGGSGASLGGLESGSSSAHHPQHSSPPEDFSANPKLSDASVARRLLGTGGGSPSAQSSVSAAADNFDLRTLVFSTVAGVIDASDQASEHALSSYEKQGALPRLRESCSLREDRALLLRGVDAFFSAGALCASHL